MATGSKSTDVAARRPYEALATAINQRAELDSSGQGAKEEAFEIAARALDGMAVADDWDSIVAAQSSLDDIADYLNVPINVTEVAFSKSDEKYRKGGLGAYVMIKGFDDSGESFAFNTGAPYVVGALFRAEQKGLVSDAGLRMKIVSKTTPNGTLYLVGKA